MSYPCNNPTLLSVNAKIDSDQFPTEWGTFNKTVAIVLSLPPGCIAATFNISAAYHLTPIWPNQKNALCIFWKGKVYVDCAAMFSLSSSTGVFGTVADMLAAIYWTAGFGTLMKWVDDFLVIWLPGQTWTEEDFTSLTKNIGAPWSHANFCLSSTIHWIWLESCFQICNITGRETQVNSTSGILLVHGRSHFLSIQSSVTTWKTSTCIQHFHPHPPFPAFDCALCDLIHHPRTHLHPPTYVCANLSWINFLLQASPYSSPLFTSDPIDINWWGDASSSFGIGVVVSQF